MKSVFERPLVRLPQPLDLTLYLIREELKSQKFFNGLSKIGIGDCDYQPQLGRAILACMEMDYGNEEILDFYYRVIEKRSEKIDVDVESVTKQALKVYQELLQGKKSN